MKIDISRISGEGFSFEEDVNPSELELDDGIIAFRSPVHVKVEASRITNAVTVDLRLTANMYAVCGRCLSEFDIPFDRKMRLNYQADKFQPLLDLNPDIREEIILSYPMKPLCKPECKGLCPKCGKDLNQGSCNC